MSTTSMRPKHIIGGLLVFALGLYLLLGNILYCVEFIKGAAQPFLIIIGVMAGAAAIFSNKTNRTTNIIVSLVFLSVGAYGVYDEYYATMDFFHGLFPPLLVAIGVICLVHGIAQLNKTQGN